jgi:hypothetical protein
MISTDDILFPYISAYWKKKYLYKKYWKLNRRTDTEVTRIAWELIDELDIFIRGNVNFEYNLKKKLISQMSLCFAVLFFS